MGTKKTKKIGRPSKYTKAVAATICKRLAEGESLRSICKDDKLPTMSAVLYWLVDGQHEEFLEQYEQARDIQADVRADEIIDIADESVNDYMDRMNENGTEYTVVNSENIQRSRLRVDARKWVASKLKPKKYGDKLDVTSGNKPIKGNGITFTNFAGDKGNSDE